VRYENQEVKAMASEKRNTIAVALFVGLLVSVSAWAQEAQFYSSSSAKPIPAGSRFFIAPMPGGIDTYIVAGIVKKKLPIIMTIDREKADYEVTGVSETEKAGWAKMFFMGSDASREQASIKVAEVKSGEVVFAYSVHKRNSARGKQSAGEACAKHLKERITAQ
jgi:hypothetical protein